MSLSLRKIMEVVCMQLYTTSTNRQLQSTVTFSSATTIDWCNFIRDFFSFSKVNAPKLVGTAENPLQIDERHFSGHRRNNKDRLLEVDMFRCANGNTTGTRKNNYNDQVTGPWVLGMYQSASLVQFIIVPDRSYRHHNSNQ